MNQIVFAVKSCNKHNIFHRDIKAANILINFDEKKNSVMAYLSDFGAAIQMEQGVKTISTLISNKTKTLIGTYMYLAPELRTQLYEGKRDAANYDVKKTDAYSLGCVIL